MIANNNSGIRTQLPIELRGAYIHRIDPSRSALQQAIREAARGRANVKARLARWIDSETVQRRFEFESSAADIRQLI
jgi:hypothetical protein